MSKKWLALKPAERKDTLKDILETKKKDISTIVPHDADINRLVATAINSVSKNPKLLDCTRDSLLLSIIKAAETGLEPDTPLQLCHLVPFRIKGTPTCQLVLGYRGALKLASESKGVAGINCQVVFENDNYDIKLGSNPEIIHRPAITEDRGRPILYYAIAEFQDGRRPIMEYMLESEIQAIRSRSAGKNSPAWEIYPTQMGRKIVLKRLCNYLPVNYRYAAAVEADNLAEEGEPLPRAEIISDLPPESVNPRSTEGLAEIVGAEVEEEGKSVSRETSGDEPPDGAGVKDEPPEAKASSIGEKVEELSRLRGERKFNGNAKTLAHVIDEKLAQESPNEEEIDELIKLAKQAPPKKEEGTK